MMRLLAMLLMCFFVSLAHASEVKIIKSANEYQAWFIEDHFLPIVSVQFAFPRSGYAYDPEDKLGLAYVVSLMLDEGAGELTGQEYKQELERYATDISFGVDADYFYIRVKTLREHLADAMELLMLALEEPRFDKKDLSRTKAQIKASVKKRQESPEHIAYRTLYKTVFKDHPYSRAEYGTVDGVEMLKTRDLQSYIARHLTREEVVISVVGDLLEEEVKRLLLRFVDFPKRVSEIPELPPVPKWEKGDTVYIKKDIPQSVIVFAAPAPKRTDPNFYQAYLANHIYGGSGFESRLTKAIREDHGLAYSTYSYIDSYDQTSILVGYAGTKSGQVDKALDLMKLETAKMQKSPITLKELADAREYIIHSFPLRLTKNSIVASTLQTMQQYKLGAGYLQARSGLFNRLSLDDVHQASREIFVPKEMIWVVVGK